MNWVRELCDLYEKNQKEVGKYGKGRFGESLILLPIFHTTVTAQITVVLSEEGEFLRAEQVADEDKLTIIPVSEKSAVRTAGVEAHPLCDNLKYLAGDYMKYVVPDKGKDYSENYQMYITNLKAWAESSHGHKKVRAIYQYLNKGCLMKDLIVCGRLKTDDEGKVLKEVKIQNVSQADAFVRFQVEEAWKDDTNGLEELSEEETDKCWKDISLQNAYIEYCRESKGERDLSYLTGEWTQISYLHPKKIRNEGDGSKLISANDETNFTYRGRFRSKEEAFAIGYEDSQKAHNALKWIIRKQGKNWKTLCVVTWESDLNELPDWSADTDRICDTYENIWGDEEKETYQGTNSKDASRFQAAIAGYGKKLDINSKMFLMAFDAATTGRLAIMENESLLSSRYLANLKHWHEECGWLHRKNKDTEFYGIVSVKDIARFLYGNEQGGVIALRGNAEKMESEVCKRLLSCILLGKPLPEDMVHLAIQKASSPVSYESWYNWEHVLTLACSFVKKKAIEKQDKEEWSVALKTDCDDRSYLYGRLLAVADRIEYLTYDRDEARETNAKRYMNAFSQQPFRTWKVIEERVRPYLPKLSIGARNKYEHMLEEIFWQFKDGDFEKNESLDGRYLLGFHNQAYALRKKQEDKDE